MPHEKYRSFWIFVVPRRVSHPHTNTLNYQHMMQHRARAHTHSQTHTQMNTLDTISVDHMWRDWLFPIDPKATCRTEYDDTHRNRIADSIAYTVTSTRAYLFSNIMVIMHSMLMLGVTKHIRSFVILNKNVCWGSYHILRPAQHGPGSLVTKYSRETSYLCE